jgi:hypothetical protein
MHALTAASQLPVWQLRELASKASTAAVHHRRSIELLGVMLSGDGERLAPLVYRSKTEIGPYREITTYDELAEVFGLAKTETACAHWEWTPFHYGLWYIALVALRRGLRNSFVSAGVTQFGVTLTRQTSSSIQTTGAFRSVSALAGALGLTRLDGIPRIKDL